MGTAGKALILGAALACAGLPAGSLAAQPTDQGCVRAAAAPRPRIEAGVELVALRQVTIQQVTLVKGSRVRVVAVATDAANRPISASLELADGYVLRAVPFAVVRANFRPEQPLPRR